MKKRYEPFPPDPASVRPAVPLEDGEKSENDFALRLAASLRAEKQAHEAAAPQRPKPLELFQTNDTQTPEPAEPETGAPQHTPFSELPPLPEDLEAELNELLGRVPEPPAPEPSEPESSDPVEPERPEPAPVRAQTPRPARLETKPSSLRSGELQPARLEVRPSAQELREPAPESVALQSDAEAPRVRADLSDKPFAPPEEDPSLEELFRLPGDEAAEPMEESEAIPAEIPEAVEIITEPEDSLPDFSEPTEPEDSILDRTEPTEPEAVPSDTPEEQAADILPAPVPPSGDTTGPLPTLEELFGPAEDSPTEESPAPAPEETAPSPEVETQKPAVSSRTGKLRERRNGALPSAAGDSSPRMSKFRNLLGSLLVSQIPEEPEAEAQDASPKAASAEPQPAVDTAPAPEPPPPMEAAPAPEKVPSVEAPPEQTAPSPEPDSYEALDLAELDALLRRFTQEDSAAASPTEPEPTSEEEAGSELAPAEAPEPAPAESRPDVDAAPAPEPVAEPEPVTESEPAAAAADLKEPTPAGGKKAARRRKNAAAPPPENGLTVQELLAAAVPMEEAAPPQRTPPQSEQTQPEVPTKQPSRRHRKNRDHAALRENAAAIAARTAAAAAAAKAAAAAQGREVLTEAASAAEKAAVPQRAHPEPAGKEPAHTPRPPRQPEVQADPVPSADVRKQPPAQHTPKTREPEAPPRQEPESRAQAERAVLHPEEAYRLYSRPLNEVGTRLILVGLFTFISLFFTLYLTQHWTFLPEIFSGGTTVYLQLGLLGLTFLVCRKPLFRSLRKTHGLHPALLLLLGAFFTALDCLAAAKTLRTPFTPVFGALALFFLWGEYDRCLGLCTTVKVLRGDALSSGVSEVSESFKGSRGLVRTPPDADHFMEKLETRDLTERVLRIFTPIAAVFGLALTLLIGLGLKQDIPWTGSLIFLGGVPTAGLLAYPRIFLLLSRRLAEADAALCGYHGAEVFGGEHSILIGDEDIFPEGSLTLNGFKVYSGNPDRIIAYAAAAVRSSGSALDPVFDDLLVTHNGRHYTVDTFRYYDSGGIGASIGEDVVLMGSLDFMRRMGVHMDKGARVKQAVYLSVNGELAAVFAVRYAPPDNLRKGLASLAANRHFKGILVTRTFLGTPAFLKAKFGIPTGTFLYPSTTERIRLSEAELKRTGAQGAILAKNSFSGFAQAVAGGRTLRSATIGAAILTVLSGIIGLILMSVLAALQARETATALNLLLYVAAWLGPTLLLTAWGRHF